MSKNKLEESSSSEVDKIGKSIAGISESIVIETQTEENVEKNALTKQSAASGICKNISMKKIIAAFLICACIVGLFAYSKLSKTQAPIFDFAEGEIEFNITMSYKYSWIKQKLDHFASNSPVWRQRVFIEDTNYNFKESSPIFLYVSNLSPLSQYQISPIFNEQSQSKGGMLIGLQMRYFGESLPFGMDSYSIDNLKYLTVNQMIEDIANVITRIKQNHLFGITIKNPWIINGAWITGTIVAWFRAKYPDLTIGAFASSPVEPTLFVEEINQRSYSNINSGGRKCRSILQKLIAQFEDDIYSKKQSQILNKQGDGLLITPQEVLYMVEDKLRKIERNWFVTFCYNEQSLLKDIFDELLMEVDNEYFDPIVYSQDEMSKEKEWKQYQLLRTTRSNWYLKCNQFGLFEIGSQKTTYISKMINQTFFRNRCKSIFGVQIWPNPDVFKQRFLEQMELASNLLIVHGFYDIWLPYGLLPNNNSEAYLDVVKCSVCQRNPDYRNKESMKEIDRILQLQKSMIDQWLEQYYAGDY